MRYPRRAEHLPENPLENLPRSPSQVLDEFTHDARLDEGEQGEPVVLALVEALSPVGAFLLFAIAALLVVAVVWLAVPETKGYHAETDEGDG